MILINLFPYREERRQKLVQKVLIAWMVVAALGVTAAFLVNSSITEHIDTLSATEKRNKKTITDLKDQLADIDDIKEKQGMVIKRLETIADLNQTRGQTIKIIDALSRSIPEKAWLTEITSLKGKILLSGIAQSNADVAEFMKQLKQSPYFSSVDLSKITQTKKQDQKLKGFSLDIVITKP
ncbi:MAG: PilN domain-containing protein, partial [Magnetococcales bacterium]|nr:PilN domain-containing protein [Magnetococcales bacterium]